MDFQKWCEAQKDNVKKQFRDVMGYELNLDNPQTLCEKLNWLKIYDSNFLKTYCADKLLVREYVKEKIGKDLFLPVLGVYNKFEEIDFSKLPKNYVIKCNHGSGMNIIVKEGKVNKQDVKQKLDSWMKTDYLHLYEFFYKPIHKKIFIEQYQENIGKNSLTDYKFLCYNGEIKYLQVINGRFTNNLHFNYYTPDFKPMTEVSWNLHPARYDLPDNMPNSFEEMKEISDVLCKDFKCVRVDFYEIENRPYLSELTFIPAGGYIKYKNKNTDLELGKLLII